MRTTPRQQLLRFYDQALMIPELMCVHCAHSAWNRGSGRCSPDRREDCILFASDMVNRLAAPDPFEQPARQPLYR